MLQYKILFLLREVNVHVIGTWSSKVEKAHSSIKVLIISVHNHRLLFCTSNV